MIGVEIPRRVDPERQQLRRLLRRVVEIAWEMLREEAAERRKVREKPN